jgi:hypothetical protein
VGRFCLPLFALLVLLTPASIGEQATSVRAQPTNSNPASEARNPATGSNTRAEAANPDLWSRLETISRILSIAAIPIVVALGGWLVQRQLQKQSVSKDYVQLAVSILREPDSSKVSGELRGWAVDLLNAYSAVKLSGAVSKVLKAGEAVLPPLEGFAASPSPALTPELDNVMQTALTSFQTFLQDAGFRIRSAGTIKYEIVPGDLIEFGGNKYYAFYDATTLTMKVASTYAGDVDLIRHEYMRHVLTDGHSEMVDIDPGSGWWKGFAIDSGLAMYFPCSFDQSSVFAANYPELRVDLKAKTKSRAQALDLISACDVGNKLWGVAFWELRERFDDPKSVDRLLAFAWLAWQPKDPDANLFVEFANKMIEIDQLQNNGQHVTDIQEVLRKRGLRI